MADITNAQAVRFSNENARPMADLTESLRRTAEQFLINVVAFEAIVGVDGQGNANGDAVIDGAATDGRPIATKGGVLALKYVCEQVVACLNQDDREVLVHNLVVNGQPRF